MICNICKQDKSDHLFQPCMRKKDEKGRAVYCCKCASEIQGHAFGQIRKGWKLMRAQIALRGREAAKEDSLTKMKRTAEKERIADLLEKRRKRLAGG